MPNPSARTALALLLLAGTAACDRTHAARDGAAGTLGIEVNVPGWRLERAATIQGESERPDELLYNVGAVAEDPEGRIYVLNDGDRRLAVYDRGGRFLRVIARRGKGPGELTSPRSVAAVGQWLYVLEQVPARILRFRRADGVFVDNLEIQAKRLIPDRLAVAPDGRVAVEFRQMAAGLGDNRASRPLVAFVDTASGTLTPVVQLDSVVRLRFNARTRNGTRSTIGTPPFSAKPVWTFDRAGSILYGNGAEYAVWRASGGRRELAFRARERPLPVTRADRDYYIEHSYAKSFADQMVFPDHKPFYAGLEVDGSGNVWVYRHGHAGAQIWEVRLPDGHKLGQIDLPAGTRLLGLAGDALYLVVRDELDVETVHKLVVKRG
jgi:hypothetical protein